MSDDLKYHFDHLPSDIKRIINGLYDNLVYRRKNIRGILQYYRHNGEYKTIEYLLRYSDTRRLYKNYEKGQASFKVNKCKRKRQNVRTNHALLSRASQYKV